MDAPKHFVDSGKTMDSYEASEWVYSKTCLVKIQAQADLLILPEHVSEQIQKDCELLLIKTGWEKFRTETKYWEHNPGLSPQLGKWLRENCPNLRMVGFDFISLTAFQHREVGREAHRTFLSAQGREAIMIAEDMSLDKLSSAPKKVIIAPLRIENADGGPITVLAEI
jgi:kynurenine formamidase